MNQRDPVEGYEEHLEPVIRRAREARVRGELAARSGCRAKLWDQARSLGSWVDKCSGSSLEIDTTSQETWLVACLTRVKEEKWLMTNDAHRTDWKCPEKERRLREVGITLSDWKGRLGTCAHNCSTTCVAVKVGIQRISDRTPLRQRGGKSWVFVVCFSFSLIVWQIKQCTVICILFIYALWCCDRSTRSCSHSRTTVCIKYGRWSTVLLSETSRTASSINTAAAQACIETLHHVPIPNISLLDGGYISPSKYRAAQTHPKFWKWQSGKSNEWK